MGLRGEQDMGGEAGSRQDMGRRDTARRDTGRRDSGCQDTIVAISTPPGRGGIGIVRMAGPEAMEIAGRVLRLSAPLEHARARLAKVRDPGAGGEESTALGGSPEASGGYPEAALDDAVVTAFFAPHSYTGEDVVEIAAHGSPMVLEALLGMAMERGARLAFPGEFTQRAFLAGRIDLTQAEAVHDLIAAQTLDQARMAAQQMGGAMGRRVAPAKSSLLHLIALLEAGMDFASGELDDVDVVAPDAIDLAISEVRAPLQQLAESFRRGALLRGGASLALVGRPNAGKSSLFNRLLERNRAIVTPVAGTTRDTVEEALALRGIPIRLIDTAGLRGLDEASVGDEALDEAPLGEAEREGIVRSREALADADLVVLVQDATVAVGAYERDLIAGLTGRPHLVVRNKIDLVVSTGEGLETSALTGEGLDALRDAILRELRAEGALADTGALNNLRQQEAVRGCVAALDAARAANENHMPHEVLLLDLHGALKALDSLTGATTADDILGMIFSQFCIGK